MRIVAVADTHTFEDDFTDIPDGDVFVHAGDMCRGGSLEELEGVARWIRELPHAHKVIVAGNHDWCFAREQAAAQSLLGDDVVYLQDSAHAIDGVKFWGSPWQPAFHDWAFNLPRGPELAQKWSLIPDDVDVLITHGPPSGFGDRSWDTRAGCRDLLAAVYRTSPALHMFGHIHQDGGFWRDGGVCFSNVTSWECERPPTVVDIDPTTKKVVEVFVPPPR